MADAKSNYAERITLDWLLGGSNPSRPSGRWAALFTSDPTDSDIGNELSGGSYERVAATFNAAQTNSGVTTSTTTLDLNWTNMPTAVVTHVGIYTESTGGELIYHGPLNDSKTLTTGDNFTINAGNLTVTEQ